jgi:hypothetical protein
VSTSLLPYFASELRGPPQKKQVPRRSLRAARLRALGMTMSKYVLSVGILGNFPTQAKGGLEWGTRYRFIHFDRNLSSIGIFPIYTLHLRRQSALIRLGDDFEERSGLVGSSEKRRAVEVAVAAEGNAVWSLAIGFVEAFQDGINSRVTDLVDGAAASGAIGKAACAGYSVDRSANIDYSRVWKLTVTQGVEGVQNVKVSGCIDPEDDSALADAIATLLRGATNVSIL